MMNILYDYQGFIQHHGGVSRYHIELIKNLRKLGVECNVPFLLSENVYLDEAGIKHSNPLPFWKSKIRGKCMKWIDQKICLSALSKNKCDVFHPTFLNPYYIGHTKGIPVVQTMHDFIHEKIERFDSEIVRAKRKKVLDNANAIICISQETKNDLQRFYDVPDEKIHLVYHGSDQNIISCSDTPLFDFPYLLYIGNRKGYKNFSRFIEAFSKIPNEIHLVCTGVPFSEEEQGRIKQLGIEKRIHQMFATEGEMKNLLCNAVAFVYSSLMEGFGLPILEAFRCQCPCIVSDTLCFHEVAGNGAVFFNPESIEDMTDKISQTIYDEQILQKLRQVGKERLKLFTWEKTAKETLNVYKTLV